MPGRPKRGGADSNPNNSSSSRRSMSFDNIKQVDIPVMGEDPSTGEATETGEVISKFQPEHGFLGRLIRGQQGSKEAADYLNQVSFLDNMRNESALRKQKQAADYTTQRQKDIFATEQQAKIDEQNREYDDLGRAWHYSQGEDPANIDPAVIRQNGMTMKYFKDIVNKKMGMEKEQADLEGKTLGNDKSRLDIEKTRAIQNSDIAKTNSENIAADAMNKVKLTQTPEEAAARLADFRAKTSKDIVAANTDQFRALPENQDQLNRAAMAKDTALPLGQMYNPGSIGSRELPLGERKATRMVPFSKEYPDLLTPQTVEVPPGVVKVQGSEPVTPEQRSKMFGQTVESQGKTAPISKQGLATTFGQTPPPQTVAPGIDNISSINQLSRLIQSIQNPALKTDVLQDQTIDNEDGSYMPLSKRRLANPYISK